MCKFTCHTMRAEMGLWKEQKTSDISNSVFVNGRGRAAIMEDMRARIARRDINLERADAIKVSFPFSVITHTTHQNMNELELIQVISAGDV